MAKKKGKKPGIIHRGVRFVARLSPTGRAIDNHLQARKERKERREGSKRRH